MGDVADCVAEQRMRGRKPRVVEDVAPTHHGAEPDAVGADLDLAQAGQFAQINQQRRLCHPERHHRHQRLAPGQRLGVAVVGGQQCHGFIDGGGTGVFEGRKFHDLERRAPVEMKIL